MLKLSGRPEDPAALLSTLAIANSRSIGQLAMPLGPINEPMP
jgi:hypothetical protein